MMSLQPSPGKLAGQAVAVTGDVARAGDLTALMRATNDAAGTPIA
jgi:hypothetical protein